MLTITLSKALPGESSTISNDLILNIFEKRLKRSYCDKIISNKIDRLIIENEDFRIKPDLNWNIWSGIKKAEVIIIRYPTNKISIRYRLNYTKAFLLTILISFFGGAFTVEKDSDLKGKITAFGLTVLIIILLSIVSLSLLLIGHRNLIHDSIQEIKNVTNKSQ